MNTGEKQKLYWLHIRKFLSFPHPEHVLPQHVVQESSRNHSSLGNHIRQAWTYGSTQGAFVVAPVIQNQPEPAVQPALCCAFFLLLTGAWREQMDKSKAWLWGCFRMLWVVPVRRGPAWPGMGPRAVLEGWCEQPAADWKPCCTSAPLCASLYRAIFESAWGDLGWKISGLPEQLIHPTAYSLLTPFLRIPKTQAAQRQAGDELWEAAASWECLRLRLGEARGSLCLTDTPSPHPTTWLAAPHPDRGWETMARVSPRGPFWQQSSLVPGLHGALPS